MRVSERRREDEQAGSWRISDARKWAGTVASAGLLPTRVHSQQSQSRVAK
jgi:hypothetical protein